MKQKDMASKKGSPDIESLYRQMERLSGTGWFVVDYADESIRFSDYIAGQLKMQTPRISIADFLALIHPDYLYRANRGTEAWEETGLYDEAYPILAGDDYVWVHARATPPVKSNAGQMVAAGSIRLLEAQEAERHALGNYKIVLAELLQSQRNISQMLLSLLQNRNIEEIINGILADIVDKFDADRSYIFSFDLAAQTHSCVYEVTRRGITSEMDDLQDYPIEASQWWCDELLAGHEMIFEDINVLQGEHEIEFDVLNSQFIKSLMVIPLLSESGVWGYIGVDIVDNHRAWSDTEKEWLRTIANYISVCLELHRAEETARRSGETMRNVYRNLPIGVELYDARGRLVEINDADMRIFGIPDRKKLAGADIFSHPVLPAQSVKTLRRGKDISLDVSHTFGQADRAYYGTALQGRRELYVKSKILRGADGRPEHYLLMVIDNTPLVEAREKAEQSDTLKSAFLANMSHEIRTPLNAIVGFSNILNETDDAADRAEFTSIIQQNNEQLLQLIADILDLSKIEAGVLDVVYGDFDVTTVCTNALGSVAMKAQPGVKVAFEAGLPSCPMYSDRHRITQVLTNFLGNAVKFTSEGSITLSYALHRGEIEFRVTDTGLGMTPEQTSTVFERFVKFNTFVQGTGLGLSICKVIAEKLGGSVGVESEPGKGSTFWMRLPYTAHSPEKPVQKPIPAEAPAPAADRSRRKKILLADDNESSVKLVVSALRNEYEILEAASGERTLELYRKHHPDLILMDIKMPGMDGLEATRAIRATDTATPIVAISAFAYESDRKQALEAGCNDFMAKPIVPADLRRTVKRFL